MYKVLRALKDTYITDRIINGAAQTAGNVGAAGSLDLFKLYGLTTTASGSYASGSWSGGTPGSGNFVPSGAFTPITLLNTELSRLLVQFDLDPLREAVASGLLDPSSPTFSCHLLLHDVYGGQPTPANFTVNVTPLSSSFDEGLGRDVVFYSDYDACNWLTSSYASGSWFSPGCGLGGDGSTPCDYISSSIGGATSFQSSQFFPKGEEDLCIDVSAAVSATLAGQIPDAGLRVSFSAAQEGDQHTYFVKRFASRTAFNTDLHPKLVVKFDDSIQDDTDNMYLDSPSYLFLYNYVRSAPANLTSGSSAVTGSNCLQLYFLADFPGVSYGVVSSSVVYTTSGTFAFANVSSVIFTGSYGPIGILPTPTSGSQLIGALSGTYATVVPYVPSGTFLLPDGTTPALAGIATFSGTLDGAPGFYALTGSFLPDGVFLFSGTYVTSATLGPVDYFIGPFLGSQLFLGKNPQTGIYSASVLLSSTDPNLLPQWRTSGSITLTPVWESLDGTVPYLTGSAIKAYPPQRGPQSISPRRFEVTVLGVRDTFAPDEETVLRVNIFDYTQSYSMTVIRLPVELPGVVVRDAFYQVRDTQTGRPTIPFDTKTNSTRISNDSAGMYFRLDTSNLTVGHTYVIDVLIDTGNNQQLYQAASPAFRVADMR